MKNTIVSASAFKLQGEDGLERGAFELVDGYPSFTLRGNDSRIRAQIDVNSSGPRLLILDENGEARVGADYNSSGPSLFLRDASGKVRISLDESGDVALVTLASGTSDTTQIEISTSEHEGPKVMLFRDNRTVGIAIQLLEGVPTISLVNADTRVAIHLAGGEKPGVWIDENGLRPLD